MIIYNPVARHRIALTKFPVKAKHFTVTDDEGQAIAAQVNLAKSVVIEYELKLCVLPISVGC